MDANYYRHGFLLDHRTYTTIDGPTIAGAGANSTIVTGINDNGQIVGSFGDLIGAHGFLLSQGVYTLLDDPDSITGETAPAGINNAGVVVGYYGGPNVNQDPLSLSGLSRGFVYNNGVFTDAPADPMASVGGQANGISNYGLVVGAYSDSIGTVHGYALYHGMFFTVDNPNASIAEFNVNYNGTWASGINNSGQIVGYYYDIDGFTHGFLLENGVYTEIDDPNAAPTGQWTYQNGTYAYDINNLGQIVGYYYDADANAHGFLLDHGVYTELDFPGAISTQACGINDSGEIVGDFANAGEIIQPFVLEGGEYTAPGPVANSSFSIALGINNKGQIVGIYLDFGTGEQLANGYLLEDGIYYDIDVPGAASTSLTGINDSGDIVGYFQDSAGDHGFRTHYSP